MYSAGSKGSWEGIVLLQSKPSASGRHLLVSTLVGPHLAHIVRLHRGQLAANRRGVPRIEPPPCDQAPRTRLVVGPNSSTIRSSHLAPDARKRMRRARSQHACQKHSNGRCCGEARLHGLRRFLHVCRPGAPGCDIFSISEADVLGADEPKSYASRCNGCLVPVLTRSERGSFVAARRFR
jgi:hypothetical protein